MVVFKAPHGHEIKKAPTGFSWTTLFFGIWPAIFRGDMRNATFILVSSMFTLGLSILVWAFIYNDMYMNKLRLEGWIEQEDNEQTSNNNASATYHDMPEMRQSNNKHNRLDILYSESDVSEARTEEQETANADQVDIDSLNPYTGFANSRKQSFGRKQIG